MMEVSSKAKDWEDLWGKDDEDKKENFANPDLFFGQEAKDKYWNMFKYI